MNINDLGTQLLYTTVPILINKEGNTISTGTGFIFSVTNKEENVTIPMLITNYHVVKGTSSGCFEIHLAENNLPTKKTVRVSFNRDIISNNKLGDLDLIAIPLASTLNDLAKRDIAVFYRTVDQNLIPSEEQVSALSALENICFIGYPSGIYDGVNKLPVIRQGITATPIWNDFNGEYKFLIDGGVYPGSSGSPVFICNQGAYSCNSGIVVGSRLYFVGIISNTYQREDTTSKAYLNLGVVISSRAFLDELKKLIDRLKK